MEKHLPEGITGAEQVPFSPRVKRTHIRWRVPVRQQAFGGTGDIKKAFADLGWVFVHTHYLIHKNDPSRTMQQYLVFERKREGDERLSNN